jgi:uncharacterized protein
MRMLAGALLVVAGFASGGQTATPSDAVSIWERSLAAQRFNDVRTIGTLTTLFPSGEEVVLKIELLAKMQPDGVSRMGLTRVMSGNALLNSTFLSIERPGGPDHLWVYLPGVGTPRRLVSSNLADSYLGSEFRYGDLVQREPAGYRVVLRADETIDGEPCAVVEIVPDDPRLARETGLGREVLFIRRSSFVERRVEQFDRRGQLLKVMDLPRVFFDPASAKSFPLERRIRNVQSGAMSTALFDEVRTDQGLAAELFSPARLADRSW